MNNDTENSTMRPVTANSLSVAEVRSPAGEDLGKVVDFMLDTARGSVVYAVLATGGVLGVGAKMLAVPPSNIRLSSRRGCLELDLDTAALDAAPGIDRTNPPAHAEAALQRATTARSPTRPHERG